MIEVQIYLDYGLRKWRILAIIARKIQSPREDPVDGPWNAGNEQGDVINSTYYLLFENIKTKREIEFLNEQM